MGKIRRIYAVLANKIRYIFLCSCVFVNRFGGDLNPIRDGYHCWLSNAFACLARRKYKDAQVSSHVSNIVKGRTIRKVMVGGGGGEFSSRRNFFSLSNSLYEFILGHSMNIFRD